MNKKQFSDLGVSIVGLTYDPVPQQRRFSGKHKITYPMLSDAESRVIKAYGLLNTEIPEDTKYFGVPYPGIFLVDRNGVIVAKFAEAGYRNRPLLEELVKAAKTLSVPSATATNHE